MNMDMDLDMNMDMKRSKESEKLWLSAAISLRILGLATSFTSGMIIFKNKQVTFLFGIKFSAAYTDDPTFKLFAYANMIAACLSALSIIIFVIASRKHLNQTVYFYFFFMHDLIMAMLITATSSAASAIGYVGKHGNLHAGWVAICDQFGQYCAKNTVAVGLSYFCLFIYLLLIIMSAFKSRQSKV